MKCIDSPCERPPPSPLPPSHVNTSDYSIRSLYMVPSNGRNATLSRVIFDTWSYRADDQLGIVQPLAKLQLRVLIHRNVVDNCVGSEVEDDQHTIIRAGDRILRGARVCKDRLMKRRKQVELSVGLIRWRALPLALMPKHTFQTLLTNTSFFSSTRSSSSKTIAHSCHRGFEMRRCNACSLGLTSSMVGRP